MSYVIAIDPGKDGAYSLFDGERYIGSIFWRYNPKMFVYDNLKAVCEQIHDTAINKKNVVIVVERPSTSMAYQWSLFYDLRDIAKRLKVGFVAFPPVKVKKIVSGYGRANKEEIRKSVSKEGINVEGLNDHMVDSIAIGLTYLKESILKTNPTMCAECEMVS